MLYTTKSTIQATCEFGQSAWLATELQSLGYKPVREHRTGVELKGDLFDCIKLNLQLSTAYSVLYLLKEFRCNSAEELYRVASEIPWETIIPYDSYFSIVSKVQNDTIRNTMLPNLKLKDAIVDRIKKYKGKRPDSGKERNRIVVHLNWHKNQGWIYLNTSGRKLSDRGYRKMPHTAPLRESLASAILLASDYKPGVNFVNPMCGSGTLAIEAALLSKGAIPGGARSNYAFKHYIGFPANQFKELRDGIIKKHQNTSPTPRIIATDIDPKAIAASKVNAEKAGVADMIEFKVCDFADTPIPEDAGIIILNPEYGERLGEVKDLEETYGLIGDWLKQSCKGWTGYVFTGNLDLAKKVGLKASRRFEFMNGKIDCRLLKYEMYHGSRD